MASKFRILSIDGGGIRGIIPALVLAEIEHQTGRRIADLFDLIAGTSTGGILALGLTRPGGDGVPYYTAEKLVRLYETEGSRIFTRSPWHRIRALGNAVEEKYPSGPVEDVLKEYFDDTNLSQAVTDVLITSYEIQQRCPFFFKSHNAKRNPQDDYLMRDAARATSAAPTYFEPGFIEANAEHKDLALIDGGVFANNPSMCALVEAICKFNKGPSDVFMVSLGTGELTRQLNLEEVKGWGLLQWAQPILSVVFDGVSDTVDYQVNSILNKLEANGQQYYRFQLTLDEGYDDIDDASRTNLRVLKELANTMIKERRKDIETVCKVLSGRHLN